MFETGTNGDVRKDFRMGGVTNGKRCGGMLWYDRVGTGGYEVLIGEWGADDFGGDESISGREQYPNTESIDRGANTDCGDGANG